MPVIAIALLAASTLVGCASPQAAGPQDTLRRYIAAIDGNDPKAAYGLLAEEARRRVTQDEFVGRWKDLKPELKVQARQLRARLKEPVGIAAEVSYPGGTRARLRFADGAWRIDAGISVAFQTATPLDAVRAFILAVEQRSYEAVMKLLARSVRKSIEHDIDDRLAKLKTWLKKEGEIEVTGDRARARYDPRFKVELVNEEGQWKVLDFD